MKADEKFCRRGNHILQRDQFAMHPTNKDGLQNWCRACMKAYRSTRELARKNSLEVAMIPKRVNYQGRDVTFAELEKLTGIHYDTLKSRWGNGARGKRLWRPLEAIRPKDPDLQAMKDHRNYKRDRQAREHEALAQKQRRRKALADAIRAEHARAFSRPLIDERLLSRREREQIATRVLGSAQRQWNTRGSTL